MPTRKLVNPWNRATPNSIQSTRIVLGILIVLCVGFIISYAGRLAKKPNYKLRLRIGKNASNRRINVRVVLEAERQAVDSDSYVQKRHINLWVWPNLVTQSSSSFPAPPMALRSPGDKSTPVNESRYGSELGTVSCLILYRNQPRCAEASIRKSVYGPSYGVLREISFVTKIFG